jgi:uncharacterized protein with PIN domain
MIVDTSALVADQEPEAERIVRTLAPAPERIVSESGRGRIPGIVMQARRGGDRARSRLTAGKIES